MELPDLILKNDINENDENLNNSDQDILDDENIDNEFYNELQNLKKNIYKSKKKIIELKKNIIPNNNLDIIIKKSNLIEHIRNRYNKLEQKMRLIELKNNRYKRCYNAFNIAIILISTSLTMIESGKAVILDECNEDNNISKYLQLSPIFLSSLITCGASILKFKKYQEKMEDIVKLIEKGNVTIGLLKKIKEELIFCLNIDEYKLIEKKYKFDIYDNYISILQEIERQLKDNDYDLYLNKIYNTDYKNYILEQKRKVFFKNFELDNNIDYVLNKTKKKKCGCFC